MHCGNRRPGIGQAGHMLAPFAVMPAVDYVQRRRDMEDQRERKGQMIGAVEDQFQSHHLPDGMHTSTGRKPQADSAIAASIQI